MPFYSLARDFLLYLIQIYLFHMMLLSNKYINSCSALHFLFQFSEVDYFLVFLLTINIVFEKNVIHFYFILFIYLFEILLDFSFLF